MGLFDQIRKKMTAPAPTDGASVEAATLADGAEPVLHAGSGKPVFSPLLRRPRVTEKAARLAEQGTYVFDVRLRAEKQAVKRAVETLYQVKVEHVHTIRGTGKFVRRGRVQGQRSDWKKALVTLSAGHKIDIHAGV